MKISQLNNALAGKLFDLPNIKMSVNIYRSGLKTYDICLRFHMFTNTPENWEKRIVNKELRGRFLAKSFSLTDRKPLDRLKILFAGKIVRDRCLSTMLL